MMKCALMLASLAPSALTATLLTTEISEAQALGTSVTCPNSAPLHGFLPILFRLGVLTKPPMASTISASDTSTSIVVRPDPNDQIKCGKVPIKTTENVVFAAPTLGNGK